MLKRPYGFDRCYSDVFQKSGGTLLLQYAALIMKLYDSKESQRHFGGIKGQMAELKEQTLAKEKEIQEFYAKTPVQLLHSLKKLHSGDGIHTSILRIMAVLVYVYLERTDMYLFSIAKICAMSDDYAEIMEYRRIIALLVVYRYVEKECSVEGDDSYNPRIRPASFFIRELLGGELMISNLSIPSLENYHEALHATPEQRRAKQQAIDRVLATYKDKDKLERLTPKDIFERLRHYVVGQDAVVKQVATSAFLHHQRIQLAKEGKPVALPPTLMLFIGSSGSGKTYTGETLGKILSLPFASFDSTQATSSGYVGLDIAEDSIKRLIQNTGDPKEKSTIIKAQQGSILLLDEIDKKRSTVNSSGLDVTGGGVQYELLRMVEGSKVILGRRSMRENSHENFDTSNMFVIFSGAFTELSKTIRQMTKENGLIGFDWESGTGKQKVMIQDAIIEYGFIPELVNRITSIAIFKPLTPPQLMEICIKPETGTLAVYNQLLQPQGIHIGIEESALKIMANFCVDTGQLARGLKFLLATMIQEHVFQGRTGEITFNSQDVQEAIGRSVAEI